MSFKPPLFHDLDDDGAPIDYTYVPSVSEGRRRQQAKAIHQKEAPSAPIDRHRAGPYERGAVDGYGTRARRSVGSESPVRDTVMKKLPSMADGPAPARSIAYPENFPIPDNPFDPPPEPRRVSRSARAGRSAPPAVSPVNPQEASPDGEESASQRLADTASRETAEIPAPAPDVNAPGTGARIALPAQQPVLVAPDGSQYEPPARPDMPEWLRVAQQNNMPLRRPEGPRVQAAPPAQDEPVSVPTDVLGRPLRSRAAVAAQRPAGGLPQTAEDYAQAGYPPELLARQLQLEREQAAQPVRRRHGAQYAVKDDPCREQAQSASRSASRQSYPPLRAEWERGQARTASPEAYGGPEAGPGTQAGRGQAYAAAAQAERAYTHPARVYAAQQGYGEADASVCAALEPDDGWQVEEKAESEARPRLNIPWLGIAAFICALAAVGLWIARTSMDRQIQQVLAARQAQEAAVREAHPLRYEELIEEKAEKYNLAPAFVAAIVLNESSFRPDAESRVGARGLMQLMEDTAAWIYEKMGRPGEYSFDRMYDAETNVEYGCWYLNFLSERFRGDPVLVAASFHAGQGEVQNWLNDSRYSQDGLTIDLENMIDGPTKQYAARVLGDYAAYKRLYYEAAEDEA